MSRLTALACALALFGALSESTWKNGAGGTGAYAYAVPSRTTKRQAATYETLSDDLITLMQQRVDETATGSWENGTHAQALLEYHFPEMAVFSLKALPLTSSMPVPSPVNQIGIQAMTRRSASTTMFVADGSAGDPASLGIAVLLANSTVPDIDYTPQVNDQNTFLFSIAPRTSDGAVSHRVSEVQLWSDFVAMVPPYLAYYGVMMGDDASLLAAYDQIRLYRQYLTNGTGLWRHILLGSQIPQDLGYWATGNAWAAWGMSRVLASFMQPAYEGRYTDLKANLHTWIVQTLTDSFQYLDQSTGLLPNYLGENVFLDASSTALMAATSYRLAQLGVDNSTIPSADIARRAVFARVNTTTGWLDPVVDPMDWSRQGRESPEGQSFTVILAAAHRDYSNVLASNSIPSNNFARTQQQGAAHMQSVPVCAVAVALLATLACGIAL